MEMLDKLLETEKEAVEELNRAASWQELERIRVKYLGRKGLITQAVKEIGKSPPEMRPKIGKEVNRIRDTVNSILERKREEIRGLNLREAVEAGPVDLTLPGRGTALGKKHPITRAMDEILEIFTTMGFKVADGPEVELDYYNFEALNIPKDHPARDMQDTFYISEEVVLRTHTSPVQIRVMEKQPPPVSIVCPGKAYRCDADVTHSPMFHQVEGLMVDRHISFAHLKGVLQEFAQAFFGVDVVTRFRPSYFPFTEPSAEMDIGCVICKGSGCRVCAGSGWIEILGSGMVDPEVYTFVNYDPEEWTGFAFGMGVERLAMLKYGVDDIRLFFENDLRFLHQF